MSAPNNNNWNRSQPPPPHHVQQHQFTNSAGVPAHAFPLSSHSHQLQLYGYATVAMNTSDVHQQQQYQQRQYQQPQCGLYGAPPPPPPHQQSHMQNPQQQQYSYPGANNNNQQQQQQYQYGYGYAAPPVGGYVHGYGAPVVQQPPPPPPPPPSPRLPPSVRTNQAVADKLRQKLASGGSRRNKSSKDYNAVKASPKANEEFLYKCPNCPNVSFPTQKALDTHISAHITCRHQGCDYTASKGLVNAHYASKHGKFAGRGLKTITVAVPGCRVQKFRVCVGNHPDDVQAWIEERKKRFPTREKVKKKSEIEARRKAEGALSSSTNNTGKKRVAELLAAGTNEVTKKPREEGKKGAKESESNSADGGNGPLSSLLGGYGSSSSDDDDNEEAGDPTPGQADAVDAKGGERSADASPPSQQEQNPFYRTRPCRFYLRTGRCRNGDNCNYLHEDGEARRSAEEQRLNQSRHDKARSDARSYVERLNGTGKRPGTDYYKYADPGAKAPLLRKLLQNDIRRERSLTLQLLRYIVDCNYLQEKKEAKEEEQR